MQPTKSAGVDGFERPDTDSQLEQVELKMQ